jgi:hypothetical protein
MIASESDIMITHSVMKLSGFSARFWALFGDSGFPYFTQLSGYCGAYFYCCVADTIVCLLEIECLNA